MHELAKRKESQAVMFDRAARRALKSGNVDLFHQMLDMSGRLRSQAFTLSGGRRYIDGEWLVIVGPDGSECRCKASCVSHSAQDLAQARKEGA